MKRQIHKKYHPRVYEEACEWFVEFRSGTPSESVRGQFYAWLHQAPAHMAAYLDVAASWGHAGAVDVTARFSNATLVAEAADDTTNVLEHPFTHDPAPALPKREPRRPFSTRVRVAFAAGLAIIVTAVGLVTWVREYPTYSTGIGEERSILLSDGSTVTLNARSRIRIHYTVHEREIDLLDGQALFSDTQDPSRPFIVRTGPTVARAVGTEFDVDRRTNETIITVLEGSVSVGQAGAAPPFGFGQLSSELAAPPLSPVYVSAGEQLAVTSLHKLRPVSVNVANAIAWTHRELVFASTPLRDVVEEFNRYNDRQLVISDPTLDRFEIDGVFSSTTPTSLVDFLRQRPDIKVTETGDEIFISRR
jgi:transmembrane sensor